jgi:5'-deoxynucleotidase YfbR-like HD superfamily hydrolase
MDNLINFFKGNHRRLAKVIRYSTRVRSFDESVAVHSYFVTLYTVVLADILIKKGIKVDKSKAMTRALLHDLSEQSSGDIIRVFREKLPKAFDKMEEMAVEQSLSTLPKNLQKEYLDNWKNIFNDLEGLIVKVSDDISGLMYCYESIQMGNKYFYGIYEHYFKRILQEIKGTELSFLKDELLKLKFTKKADDGS